jgi:hypothetical protein
MAFLFTRLSFGVEASAEQVNATLSKALLLQLRQATPEQLAAIERYLAGQPLSDLGQNPQRARWPAAAESPQPAGGLTATIEGDPASGRFCIRVLPAKEARQELPAEPPEPDQENLSIAAKVFELLTALDPEQRLRKAPPTKVFLLRFRQNLSRSEIARICRCDKSLVAVRLKTLQEKLPWQPKQLRELSAQVEALQEAVSDSRAKRIYRKGVAYGGEDEGGDPD